MSNLSIFDFNQNKVRVVSQNPFNPLFVAYDVAKALGYKDTTNALKLHCKGVAKYHPLVTKAVKQAQDRLSKTGLKDGISNHTLVKNNKNLTKANKMSYIRHASLKSEVGISTLLLVGANRRTVYKYASFFMADCMGSLRACRDRLTVVLTRIVCHPLISTFEWRLNKSLIGDNNELS